MKWEQVITDNRLDRTERLKLPTGWLIRASMESGIALCFFPDPSHEWKVNGGVTDAKVESGSKQCWNCTKANRLDANFCYDCGVQFGEEKKVCPLCETEYPLSERFCPRDGTPLQRDNVVAVKDAQGRK